MTDQKAENLLNLALATPESERMQTDELNVGYDTETKSWELIVKYSGNLKEMLNLRFPQVEMRELLGGFAVLEVPEELVDDITNIEEIEFIEKPKRLYFALNRARAASCFLQVQTSSRIGGECPENGMTYAEEHKDLSGCGILIGIVDSGIDYFHDDFRKADGSSRILFLYDQVLNRVFTKSEIDAALAAGDSQEARMVVPSVDASGHGTAVAGIAAGNGRESDGRYRGAAYGSELVVVRLGIPDPEGFPRTTQVMEGVDFVIRKSLELGRPVAVNLSFGNAYGSHDGDGLFERFLDQIAETGRSVFVVGTGNEGDKAGHTSGRLMDNEAISNELVFGKEAFEGIIPADGLDAVVELSVAPYESGFGVQLWKNYEDDFELFLTNPSGRITEKIANRRGAYEIDMDGAKILLYYGEPGPFLEAQEIYFEFLPKDTYVESGIWKFTMRPVRIVDGRYDFWLPSSGALNQSTRFLRPTPDTTLTIPSTAHRPISVGAYDDSTNAYAAFSGRGDTRVYRIPKPDIAAPGVNIIAPQRGGGYAPVTGTSFAAPLVTGAAALLMEWGIVLRNDPYLYGDKVKAYLRKGARPLPGENRYPNPRVGWGKLCVADSFPSE